MAELQRQFKTAQFRDCSEVGLDVYSQPRQQVSELGAM